MHLWRAKNKGYPPLPPKIPRQEANSYIRNDIGYIDLGNGVYAMVDIDDFPRLSQWLWHVRKSGGKPYAKRSGNDNGRIYPIYMHRVIMNCPDNLTVDHINGDVLDNRKANLRICTGSENLRNTAKRAGGTSRYKGVCRIKDRPGFWQAHIVHEGKQYNLGTYETEHDAAYAYNNAARHLHGEFGRLNQIQIEKAASYGG